MRGGERERERERGGGGGEREREKAEENTVAFKAEAERKEERNAVQHICKTCCSSSGELSHSGTRSYTRAQMPVHRLCALEAVMSCGISSISWCHTGMSVALDQCVPVAL